MKMAMSEFFDGGVAVANADAESDAVESKTTNKRDPLAKFNALSLEDQSKVEEIVANVESAIGGDSPDLGLLLGILDKLNGLKKTAREVAAKKAKAEKEDQARKESAKGEALKSHLVVGDKINYVAKTAKLTFIDVPIVKITEKRIRVEIDANTRCIDNTTGNEMTVGDIPTYKLGMKSIQFQHVLKVNGIDTDDIIG